MYILALQSGTLTMTVYFLSGLHDCSNFIAWIVNSRLTKPTNVTRQSVLTLLGWGPQ